MDVANPPTAAQAPKWDSIEELFAALESPLLGYALRLVGERSTAEDLVQDAFMKLHAQFAEVREPERWLYRAVHNAALNHRRNTAKTTSLPAGADSSNESYATQATLDERSRELIRLKFNEDLSYQQISERTGLKVGHVGYLLHHALKAIADELAKSGVVK